MAESKSNWSRREWSACWANERNLRNWCFGKVDLGSWFGFLANGAKVESRTREKSGATNLMDIGGAVLLMPQYFAIHFHLLNDLLKRNLMVRKMVPVLCIYQNDLIRSAAGERDGEGAAFIWFIYYVCLFCVPSTPVCHTINCHWTIFIDIFHSPAHTAGDQRAFAVDNFGSCWRHQCR